MPIFQDSMNVFWSDLITMVPEWNHFIFMQIDYPRWPPGSLNGTISYLCKLTIQDGHQGPLLKIMKMTISQEPLVEIDPALCQNVS